MSKTVSSSEKRRRWWRNSEFTWVSIWMTDRTGLDLPELTVRLKGPSVSDAVYPL